MYIYIYIYILKKNSIDTHVATILVNCSQKKIDELHANPDDEDLKIENVEVIYVK